MEKALEYVRMYFSVYKRVFDYRGVSSRKEFFVFSAVNAIIVTCIALTIMNHRFNGNPYTSISDLVGIFNGTHTLFSLPLVAFGLPLVIRRIRDVGLRWYWFFAFVLYVAIVRILFTIFGEFTASYVYPTMKSISDLDVILVIDSVAGYVISYAPLLFISSNRFGKITPTKEPDSYKAQLKFVRKESYRTRLELNNEIIELRKSIGKLTLEKSELTAENTELRSANDELRAENAMLHEVVRLQSDDLLKNKQAKTENIAPQPHSDQKQAPRGDIYASRSTVTSRNTNTHEQEYEKTLSFIKRVEASREKTKKPTCAIYPEERKMLKESNINNTLPKVIPMSNAERDEVAKRIARKINSETRYKNYIESVKHQGGGYVPINDYEEHDLDYVDWTDRNIEDMSPYTYWDTMDDSRD